MNQSKSGINIMFQGLRALSGIASLLVLSSFLSSCSLLKPGAHKKDKLKAKDTTLAITDTSSAFARPDSTQVAAIDTSVKSSMEDPAVMALLIEQLTPLWQTRLEYTTFSGKAKLHFESLEGSNDFSANFRIRKDSVIWINITAFGGLPAARIFITPDSFFMTIPLKQQAKRLPLTEAAKVLPTTVDFASLQNLLVGEPLRDGKITWAANAGDSISISVEDSAYIQQITYSKADSTMRSGQLNTKASNGPQALNTYKDYKTTANRKVSMERVLHIQNRNDIYLLEMSFTNINFDEALEYPFSIPKNYKVK